MTMALALILLGLALADSTSIGTLVIPIWFLLAATVRPAAFLVYVATVALFYFFIGVVGLLGAVPALQALGKLPGLTVFLWVELLAGLCLVVLAFWLDPKRRRSNKESRVQKWQRLVFSGQLGTKSIVRLGLAATTIELMTMVPYIAAIALLSANALSWSERIAGLGSYVAVMIAPALILLGIRLALHAHIDARLKRFNTWIIANADDVFSWTVGIIGSAAVTDAVVRLIIAAVR